MTESDDLHQKQINRETDAVNDAKARYRKDISKQLLNARPAHTMVAKYWRRLAKRIADEQKTLALPEKSAEKYRIFMLAIEADSLAVLTLHAIIDSQRWQEVEEEPDDTEELRENDEAEWEAFRVPLKELSILPAASETAGVEKTDAEGATLASLERNLQRQCEYHWIISMTEAEREAGLERCISRYSPVTKKREEKKKRKQLYGQWKPGNRARRLGQTLLELAEEAEVIKIGYGKPYHRQKKAKIVTFNRTFEKAFIEESQKHKQSTPPFRRPMLVEPNEWIAQKGGGYLVNHDHVKLPLVKENDAAGSVTGLMGADWTTTHEAINALQRTRWKINGDIFVAMQKVRDMAEAGELDNLSVAQRNSLGIVDLRSKSQKKTKKEPVRYLIDDKCGICGDIKDATEVFFPYQVDYRGRTYPISAGVNPQVDDVGRSLLQFAAGERLDKIGARWLAVHVANSWGRDVTQRPKPGDLGKASFRDRLKWVRTNAKSIKECAADPYTNRWWMKAAKPWRFLAACIEWSQFRSNPRNFDSCLPVTIDGTCNGLQHIAALRLNAQLADETNLAPSDEPKDIYRTIANQLKLVLETEKEAGVEVAAQWLKEVEIDRDVCKSAVMTTPYGVTRYGIASQLFDETFTAALHIPGHGPIRVKHIQNYGRLEQRLRSKEDDVSRFIWSRLPSPVRKAITSVVEDRKKCCKLVVDALNHIVQGEPIFDGRIFTKLSDETTKLLNSNPEGADLARLNKLLLLDAYRVEIRRTQGTRWRCCWYLAGKLEECIRKTVDPGDTLKTWLQSVAEVRAEANEGISWVSPSGFAVTQKALHMKKHNVGAGRMAFISYTPKLPPQVDLQKQKSKITPNFIHSLDAAHLMRTVRSLKAEKTDKDGVVHKGLRDFGVIHDGYVVHACHVHRLQKTLREEFIKMYSKDLLRDFRSQQSLATDCEMAEPPSRGDFDITQVKKSQYFFC